MWKKNWYMYGKELKAQEEWCLVQCEGSWYCATFDESVQQARKIEEKLIVYNIVPGFVIWSSYVGRWEHGRVVWIFECAKLPYDALAI